MLAATTPANAALEDLELGEYWAETAGSVSLVGVADPVRTGGRPLDTLAMVLPLNIVGSDEYSGATYSESTWAGSEVDATAMSKVAWIAALYEVGQPFDPYAVDPDTSLDEGLRNGLAQRGFDETILDGLSTADIVAGMQAAIWHFTQEAEPDPAATDSGVLDLYEFLIGDSNDGIAEPLGSDDVLVEITPDHGESAAGELIGPFTISTNTSQVHLVARDDFMGDTISVVDEAGDEVSVAADGDEVFVGPADEITGTLSANSRMMFAGQVFVSDNAPAMIVVDGATDTYAGDYSTLEWVKADDGQDSGDTANSGDDSSTPDPTPSATSGATSNSDSLPATGADSTLLLVGGGLLLLLIGGGLLVVSRRRGQSS